MWAIEIWVPTKGWRKVGRTVANSWGRTWRYRSKKSAQRDRKRMKKVRSRQSLDGGVYPRLNDQDVI